MGIGAGRFSDTEVDLLRFLKEAYLQNPKQTANEWPESRSIIQRFSLKQDEYYAIVARFEDFRLAKVGARGCVDEFVEVNPSIVEIVEQLANPPPPDYLEKAKNLKKLALTKPWLAIPIIVVMLLVWLACWFVSNVQNIKTLFEWFSVK